MVVSRAVAPLKDLWSWSKPLLKKKTRAKRAYLPKRWRPYQRNIGKQL